MTQKHGSHHNDGPEHGETKIDVVKRLWDRHENERTEDQKSEVRQLRWTQVTTILVAAYTIFTAVQVYLAKKQVYIAQQTYNSSQRPYVGIEGATPVFITIDSKKHMLKKEPRPSPDSTQMEILINIKNFGPVPGTNYTAVWSAFVGGIRVNDVNPQDNPIGPETIFPGGGNTLGTANIRSNYSDVVNGVKEWRAKIKIEYDGPSGHYTECNTVKYIAGADAVANLGNTGCDLDNP